MGLDLYKLTLRFWNGESGRSYRCRRHLCGRYTDHYVDEVERYSWWLHGYRIAQLDGRVLTLDTHGWHTLMTMYRMNYVLAKLKFYVEMRHSRLMLVNNKTYPPRYYPIKNSIKIDVESKEVVDGPTPLYFITRTGRTKVSATGCGQYDMVFVMTRVDPKLVSKISGTYGVVGDGRVTLAIGVGSLGIYMRPAGWYREFWFEVPEKYVPDLIESIPKGDKWFVDEALKKGESAAANISLLMHLLK